jgi:hypothetical protein
MAFDTAGQARLAYRPTALYTSVSDANFKYIMNMVWFAGAYQIITSDASAPIFSGSLDGSAWTNRSDYVPGCSTVTDATIFKDATTTQLIVTTDTNFAKWNGGGTINYALGTLTTGVPHPCCIFDSNPTYKLAIGNGNLVHTYDTAYNLNATILTLPSQFQVTTMRYRNGYLYIGTKHLYGGEARLFIWNGSGTNAQYECPVGAEWIYSLTEYGSSVAAVTSEGQLIQISGSSFTVLANFPVYNNPHARWNIGNSSLIGKVLNRGMKAVGQSIYINIDGQVDSGFMTEMKSGLWVYEPSTGLTHRATSSTNEMVRDTTFTVSGETLTTSATHNLKTGDGVTFYFLTGITGAVRDTIYYVTVTGTNTIKLSQSKTALANSRYLQLGGTATADTLIYFPNTDNGSSNLTTSSGAITLTTASDTPLKLLSSEVLWGNRTRNESGTAVYTLNSFVENNNVGSFTTQRIYTDTIEQDWKEIYTFLDGVVTSGDSLVVKVQTKSQPNTILLNGAWASATVLNSVNSYDYTVWEDIEIGDELIFVDGKGQGKTAHVTDISLSASTVSLTLDESIGTASTTVYFYRTNFKKVGSYTTDTKGNEFFRSSLTDIAASPWIKIKCEIRGNGIAVNMLELSNVVHKNTQ